MVSKLSLGKWLQRSEEMYIMKQNYLTISGELNRATVHYLHSYLVCHKEKQLEKKETMKEKTICQ